MYPTRFWENGFLRLVDFELDRSEPFTAFLFFRKDSRKAADLLMEEFRSKDGRMTEKEMGDFVRTLTSGERGFRFSKQNFYNNVLGTFRGFGFIAKVPTYDAPRRRSILAYRVVTQPVLQRKPIKPSFLYLANETGKWWNDIMFPEDKS